ncbi:MAG: GAF domain-containing protein [Ignavibacteriaceae bacterium]|nr:GAF domain-containing protein [Ignavibacteriaceae bacterium]
MAETITLNKDVSIDEKYKLLIKQIKSLLNKNENILSNLSNFTAALKQTFNKISWVGFYLYDGKELYLGPFQGKVACTKIQLGKGVCGTSAKKRETLIVPDVDKFPEHIACDVESKSEIVVPIIKDDKLYGVLDLDSSSLNSFDETDKKYLEELVNFLVNEIL